MKLDDVVEITLVERGSQRFVAWMLMKTQFFCFMGPVPISSKLFIGTRPGLCCI
mgnify:CR=1 FL=1